MCIVRLANTWTSGLIWFVFEIRYRSVSGECEHSRPKKQQWPLSWAAKQNGDLVENASNSFDYTSSTCGESLYIRLHALVSSGTYHYTHLSRYSDGLRAGLPRNRSSIRGRGKRFFCSPRSPDRLRGPPSPLSSGYRGLFPRDYSPPSSAEDKNDKAIPPLPHTSSRRDNVLTSTPPLIENVFVMSFQRFLFSASQKQGQRDGSLVVQIPALITVCPVTCYN
jgi:hypothetical protein